jgi:hypothetical protein
MTLAGKEVMIGLEIVWLCDVNLQGTRCPPLYLVGLLGSPINDPSKSLNRFSETACPLSDYSILY